MQLRPIVESQVAHANTINGLMVPVPLQLHVPTKQYGRTQHSTASPVWDQIVLPVLLANQHFISLIIKKDFAAHAKQAMDHSAPVATQPNARLAKQATSSPQTGSRASITPA